MIFHDYMVLDVPITKEHDLKCFPFSQLDLLLQFES